MRTILAAALLLASASVSNASQLPKKMIGLWCHHLVDGSEHTFIEGVSTCDADSEEMTFTVKGYEGPEYSCRFVAVKTWRDRSMPYSNREMGAPTATIDASCQGERARWRERLVVSLSLGTLVVKEISKR